MNDPNADSDSPKNENSQDSQGPELFLSEEDSLNSDTETEFEEQEGEVLPPEEKKKSRAGAIFIFIVLFLFGSGGYLYLNNLVPAEFLNLISPKSTPPKSSALGAEVSPTPLAIEEELVEIADTRIVPEKDSEIPVPIATTNQDAVHISGGPAEPVPSTRISGNNFDLTPDAEPEEEIDLHKEVEIEEPEIVTEVTEAQETTSESNTILPSNYEEPSSTESTEPIAARDEAVQAYLDFIESSIQKLGELIKDGFNLGRDYIQKF